MYDSGTAGPGLSLSLAPCISLSRLNSDPIYFWQQTAEDITVCVRMPEGVTKEEVQFRLMADNIRLGVQGFPPLLEGQLFASVDPEASAWIIKNDKRFASWNVSENHRPGNLIAQQYICKCLFTKSHKPSTPRNSFYLQACLFSCMFNVFPNLILNHRSHKHESQTRESPNICMNVWNINHMHTCNIFPEI